MKIITSINKSQSPLPKAIAIGSFDGVHIGHQEIIKFLKKISQKNKLIPYLFFFEPLPKEFFLKQEAPSRIYDFRNKIINIEKTGIKNIICQKFNQNFANMDAKEFIKILTKKLNVIHIIVGDDFNFGKERKGTYEVLKNLSVKNGFEVDKISTLNFNRQRVSSTSIRNAFGKGDLKNVEKLLGKPYKINGKVIYGEQNGRKIGYPTANLKLPKNSVLKGVFLTKVYINENSYYGISNAGKRPTIDGQSNLLETNIFDFNENIYNKHILILIIKFIRSEKKFDSFDQLKEQIFRDTQIARKMILKL